MISEPRSEKASKVNIFTDIDKAAAAGIEEGLKAGERTMTGLMSYEIEAVKKQVRNKLMLFGSDNKV